MTAHASLRDRQGSDDLGALGPTFGLSDEQIERVRQGVSDTGLSWVAVLARFGLVDERVVARALAERHGLSYAETLTPSALGDLKLPAPAFLRARKIAPLGPTPSGLLTAVVDPADTSAMRALETTTGRALDVVVAPLSVVEGLLDLPARETEDAWSAELDWIDTGEAALETHALRDLADQAPVIRLVDQVLGDAVARGASDVHIESARDQVLVRIRVDGMLQVARTLPKRTGPAVSSRIKVLAGMDVANRRSAQDGRATISVRGRPMDVRVSTVPGLHGETVAVRLLDRDAIRFDLDRLGFSAPIRDALDTMLSRPQGLILVTGPTGHGKTTTLYALLRRLNDGGRKILTIEDPVEYELEGVTQVQVNEAAGVSFATGLRAFLRQDPDIILVGEIRDTETARIAAQAALTGHLVLATLHTNDAPSAVARLRDMGLEPFLISATLSGVLAQRLIRTLCTCATPLPADAVDAIALRAALGAAAPQTLAPKTPLGCEKCGRTGFSGRAAVAEAIVLTPEDGPAITDGDQSRFVSGLQARGFRTLTQDGADRAASGQTSWTEIVRVTGSGA